MATPKFRTVNSYLSWDHDRLDHILEEVKGLVEDAKLAPAAQRFEEFYRGLLRHIRLEEEEVFPVFESRSGMAEGPTAVMRSEHRLIRQELEAMHEALGREDGKAFLHARERAMGVLAAHTRKEELVLYPMSDRVLDETERAALVHRLTTE